MVFDHRVSGKNERCTFIFGVNVIPNLVKMAKEFNESDWQSLEKKPKYQVKTRTRRQPKNVKQEVVKRRKFKKKETTAEDFVHLT